MTKPDLKNTEQTMGYMIAQLDNIYGEQKKTNGRIVKLESKVQKHEVIFGKLGVAYSMGLFVLVTIWSFVIDFIKDKFLS